MASKKISTSSLGEGKRKHSLKSTTIAISAFSNRSRLKSRPVSLSQSNCNLTVDAKTCNPYQAAREGRVDILKQQLHNDFNFRVNDLDDDGLSMLHHATRYNQDEVVVVLSSINGIHINVRSAGEEQTPLHIGALYKSEKAVACLLQAGADKNAKDNKNRTPLHYAARRGHTTIAKILTCYKDCQVDLPDIDNSTPLHMACMNGNDELVDVLISRGGESMATDCNNMTPIMLAAAGGHNKVLQKIIDYNEKMKSNCSELINHKDIEGATALHLAIQNQQRNAIKFLLAKGADPMARKKNGVTPLHLAAAQGMGEIISTLCKYGAFVNCYDFDECTPLHRAAQYNRVRVLPILIRLRANVIAKDRDTLTPCHLAAWKGQLQTINFFLENTALETIFETDNLDRTPLHWAVIYGNDECAAKMIQAGGLPLINMKDFTDNTVLHHAAANGRLQILRMLLNQGANPSVKDREDRSALHYAAKSGHCECVDALLTFSSQEVNDNDVDGRTALHMACLSGHTDVLKLLLNFGGDLSNRDDHYCTPLMLASAIGHLATVEILLTSHADVLANDRLKNTALHYACANGHVQVVLALLEARGDVCAKNSQNQTPLDIAIENVQQEVAKAMLKHRCWKDCMEMKDEFGLSPLEKLIIKLPEAAKVVLDNTSQKSNLDESDPSLITLFDFRYLDPGPNDLGSLHRYYALMTMAAYGREKLLSHPISQANMNYKWKSFGKKMCTLNVIFYLFYLILLFIHAESMREDYMSVIEHCLNDTDNSFLTNKYQFQSDSVWNLSMTRAFIYFLSAISLFREMVTIYQQKFAFIFSVDNWCAIAGIVFSLMFAHSYICQYRRFGWVALFCVWLNFTLYLRRVPIIGIYIIMFLQVLSSLMKAVLMFIFFLLAFSMSFYVIFAPTVKLEKDNNPFGELLTSIYMIFTMTIGEIDFKGDFLSKFHELTGYVIDVYILLGIFLFIMPVVLMNLLIGIAVGDIGQIQQNACIKRLSLQVDLLCYTENMLPAFLQRRLYRRQLQVQPNRPATSLLKRLAYFLGALNRRSMKAAEEINEYDLKIQSQFNSQAQNILNIDSKLDGVNEQLKIILDKLDKRLSTPTEIIDVDYKSMSDARRKFFKIASNI